MVEGTVDLAFYEDTSDFVGWTVVDFKTDREVEAMSVYIAQVKVYSEAISAGAGHHSSALMKGKILGEPTSINGAIF